MASWLTSWRRGATPAPTLNQRGAANNASGHPPANVNATGATVSNAMGAHGGTTPTARVLDVANSDSSSTTSSVSGVSTAAVAGSPPQHTRDSLTGGTGATVLSGQTLSAADLLRRNEPAFQSSARREETAPADMQRTAPADMQRRSAFSAVPRNGYSEVAEWRYIEQNNGNGGEAARVIRFDARASTRAHASRATPPPRASYDVDSNSDDSDGGDGSARPEGNDSDEDDEEEAANAEQERQSEEILRAARAAPAPPANRAAPTNERPAGDGATNAESRGGSRDPARVVLSSADAFRLGLTPGRTLNASPNTASRRVSDGVTNDRPAAKSAPAAADELEAARREIEKLTQHLTDADASAARQREQLEVELRSQTSRLAEERQAYEAKLLKIVADNRADIDAIRRGSRDDFASAVDQVRAESTRTIAELERRHREELNDLTARLRAGSGTSGSPPPLSPLMRTCPPGRGRDTRVACRIRALEDASDGTVRRRRWAGAAVSE